VVQNSDASLPSLDSSGVEFADFYGTIKALWLPAILLAALRYPSLGDTSCCAIAMSEGRTLADLLWSPGLFRDCTWKRQDLSSSRESSIARLLLFQRPRSDQLFRPLRKVDVVPVDKTAETPTMT